MKVVITIEAELDIDDNHTELWNGEYELPVTNPHAEFIEFILQQEIIIGNKSIGTIHWEHKSVKNWI